jgi:hypothetical protein
MTTSHDIGIEDSAPDMSSSGRVVPPKKPNIVPDEAKAKLMEQVVEKNKEDIAKVSEFLKDSSKIDTIIDLLTKIHEDLKKD